MTHDVPPAREQLRRVGGVRAFSPGRGSAAYRPDLDGLRAVAVTLVVLNHVGMAGLAGGFVGVDVFFVISGFLITGLIAEQRSQGQFAFGAFYLRRAIRLLPALYLVMIAVMAAGYVLMLPSDFSLLAQSVASAVFLGSNYFFWLNSGGYFSPMAASLPLLHVWSLSVEEQFYLVWPSMLLLVLRAPSARLRLGLVGAAAFASFVYAQYGVRHHGAGAAYFLLPARGGEFLIGALLALWPQSPAQAQTGPRPVTANLLGGLGLLFIALSALLLTARSPFPGVNALAPCLGTASIIAAGRFGPSAASRLLSLKPLVFLGLISYSVYLWHWPLVSFVHYARVPFAPVIALAVVVGSIVLGYATWRVVENDYRARLHQPGLVPRLLAGLGVAAVVGGALGVYTLKGLPQRFPFALLTQDQLTAERGRYWRGLVTDPVAFSPADPARKVLVVGDSHAYDLTYALTGAGFDGKVRLVETYYHCFNFGHDAVLAIDKDRCQGRLQAVLTSPDLRVADAVYLHDHWGGQDLAGLADMIVRIRSATAAPIYVIGPKMTFTDDALTISKVAQGRHDVTVPAINAFAAAYQNPAKATWDAELARYFQAHPFRDVHYISALQAQCGPAARCDILSADGEYLYFDADHFTLRGAKLFGQRLRKNHPELF